MEFSETEREMQYREMQERRKKGRSVEDFSFQL